MSGYGLTSVKKRQWWREEEKEEHWPRGAVTSSVPVTNGETAVGFGRCVAEPACCRLPIQMES